MEDFVEQVSADRPGSASVQRSAMLEVRFSNRQQHLWLFVARCGLLQRCRRHVSSLFCPGIPVFPPLRAVPQRASSGRGQLLRVQEVSTQAKRAWLRRQDRQPQVSVHLSRVCVCARICVFT